jgi:outer membrane protein OmpA-like peptidoglycan-associated protein
MAGPRLARSLNIVFIAVAGLAPPAAAFDGPAIEARAGAGVSGMLTSAQRDQGFRTGFVPGLRPALRVDEAFAAEMELASWFFPRDAGTGRATLFGAGLRWDPSVTSWLSWFLDGHGGLALTGQNNRLMVDAGTGVEIWLTRTLAVGPFLRYGQIVDGGGPDPRFWTVGLGATVTWSGSSSDEPPSLGGGPHDHQRDERQKEWERTRQADRQSPAQRDRDGDGIVDERDICPDERPGPNPDPTMPGCPRQEPKRAEVRPPESARPADGDRDGDGVPDSEDKCPERGFGQYPDPLSLGCPLADRDQDGVPDVYDACPGQPGIPDSRAKSNGCAGLAKFDRGGIQVTRPISFAGHGDNIAPSSIPVLQAVAALLKATPTIRKVSVEGHTDGTLPARQSFELSERRAESVRRWLVNNGVEANRLRARGRGDTQPVASNMTARGRAANARVEFVIVDGNTGLSP